MQLNLGYESCLPISRKVLVQIWCYYAKGVESVLKILIMQHSRHTQLVYDVTISKAIYDTTFS